MFFLHKIALRELLRQRVQMLRDVPLINLLRANLFRQGKVLFLFDSGRVSTIKSLSANLRMNIQGVVILRIKIDKHIYPNLIRLVVKWPGIRQIYFVLFI